MDFYSIMDFHPNKFIKLFQYKTSKLNIDFYQIQNLFNTKLKENTNQAYGSYLTNPKFQPEIFYFKRGLLKQMNPYKVSHMEFKFKEGF